MAFDLFDTLVWIEEMPRGLALRRLCESLANHDIQVDEQLFGPAYRQAVISHIDATKLSGRETHNRYWLKDALSACGLNFSPDDPRLSAAIDQYFLAFNDRVHLLPGTVEMLTELKKHFKLALLSNFTHGPAARGILDRYGLSDFFEVILISGEVGFRKPHRHIFQRLIKDLNTPAEETIFVGDNVVDDIEGSQAAGLQPVWTSYVLQLQGRFSQRWFDSGPVKPSEEVPEICNWDDLLTLLS